MNCPRCGSLLPPGAQFCNVCNEPLVQSGYQPYPQASYAQGAQPAQPYAQGSQPMQPYAQGTQPAQPYAGQPPAQQAYPQGPACTYPGYQPSYEQRYGQFSGPQGYPQGYGGYYGEVPQPRGSRAFFAAQLQLPGMLRDAFRDPGCVLQGIMEQRNWYPGPVVAGLTLLLTFLSGMFFATGMVQIFFGFYTAVTGNALARDSASLSQGIGYVSGKIGPAIGGIAVLCQGFAMVLPLVVMLVYLCAVSKVRFSWELAYGCFTVTTLPTVAVALAALLISLAMPILSALVALLGAVISYVFMGSLLGRVTGKPEQVMAIPKILCISLSILLTLLFIVLVGGTLMNGVVQSAVGFLGNLNSLM